jgi:hypothetical protein
MNGRFMILHEPCALLLYVDDQRQDDLRRLFDDVQRVTSFPPSVAYTTVHYRVHKTSLLDPVLHHISIHSTPLQRL